MKIKSYILITVFAIVAMANFAYAKIDLSYKTFDTNASKIILSVPFITETLGGSWTGPWKNACEEVSIAMVENYYLGNNPINKNEVKKFVIKLFNEQDLLFGSNANSNAEQTVYLINTFSSFNGVIKNTPTIEEIKNEIIQRRPVITLHRGFDLKNKNIPFLVNGSSYHMLVVVGYDEEKKEFVVHDDGDQIAGKNHRYNYDLFMNSLHDYDSTKKQASGIAKVIFTYPKLVKILNQDQVYFLSGQTSQLVSNPGVFKIKGWGWNMVNLANKDWMKNFIKGNDI